MPVPGECVAITYCPARCRRPGESGGALCCRPSQHKSRVSSADCVTRSGDPKELQCPELGLAMLSGLSPETMIAVISFIAPTAQRLPSRCSRMVWRPKLSRQESLRIPKTTSFFDWVNKAREAGTMTAAGDILKNRCDSMPRRVAALLYSQGGPTKY